MNEITIHTADISSEVRYPIRVPNPNETVEQIIQDMQNNESVVDSPEVDAEIVNLSTGGIFFGKKQRPCLNIKLRDTKVSALKKFGCAIVPQVFGNLVYLVKYEYMEQGLFDMLSGTKEENLKKIKSKLNTLDKWTEYTFIQTLGDFIFVEMLEKYDSNFKDHLEAYKTFHDIQ